MFRFQIMLGVGNDLVEPNLMGKKLDGEKLSKLFSQKTVWLLPENDLLSDNSQHPTTSAQSPTTTSAEYPATNAVPIAIAQFSTSSTHITSIKNTRLPTSSVQYPMNSAQFPTTSSDKFVVDRAHLSTTNVPPCTNTQSLTTSAQSNESSNAQFPTPGSSVSSEGCKIQLCEMFPNKEISAIEHVMASSVDLEEAISKLLDATDQYGNR